MLVDNAHSLKTQIHVFTNMCLIIHQKKTFIEKTYFNKQRHVNIFHVNLHQVFHRFQIHVTVQRITF